jgi:NADH-quinone oxidoreductase subunit M
MVFTLANVGLPGTTGFIGEFLSLIGTFKVNTWVATLAALGLITSACYALWLYLKVIFGKLEKPALAHILDLSPREIITFAPLLILTILFGIYPKPVLDMSAASVTALMENYQHSIARNAAPPPAGPQLATGHPSAIKINYVIAGEGTAAPVAASGK